MEDKLLKIIKELKNIQPDQEYAKRSRYLILSAKTQTRKPTFAEILNYWLNGHRMAAFGIISVFVLTFTLTAYYVSNDKNKLVVEANEINSSIKIELNKINYQLQNPREINMEKIGDVQKILNSAVEELKNAEKLSSEEKIKESLDKIKAAKDALEKIEPLLIKN